MTHPLQFDAVIFDMDGLMFDTERIGFEAFCRVTRMHGYEPEDFFMDLIGKTVPDADRAMKEAFGPDFPIATVRADRTRLISELRRKSGIPIKAGLIELLKYLKTRDLPLGIASSSTREIVEENLRHAGIRDDFQVIVCGDEIMHGKPDPEIYLKTADRLSIDPSRCIVLEDSLLGIAAAHSAGMISVMIPDMQAPTATATQMAHRIFPSLHEVRTYLIAAGS